MRGLDLTDARNVRAMDRLVGRPILDVAGFEVRSDEGPQAAE